MGSGAIKWHVHCSVCGAFIEKSAQSDSEVECKKCRSTLEIFVKDDMVSVRPIHIRDEQLKVQDADVFPKDDESGIITE